jgi:tetratricopeptide (TPR) repeat protein
MKTSLSCITGNCERDIVRFLNAFQPHFDEVVIVRAIGSKPPDKTLEIAAGRGCVVGEYRNAPENNWPHVDDFSAARNMSARMATGDWICWADIDDDCEGFEKLRGILEKLPHEMWILKAPYIVPEQGTAANYRERCWRNNGKMQWVNAIHENLASIGERPAPDGITDAIKVLHVPQNDREPNGERNLRILESVPEDKRTVAHQWYHFTELARIESRHNEAVELGKKFLANPESGKPEKYEAWLMFANLSEDVDVCIQFLKQAWAECPDRAEALYELANLYLMSGEFYLAESVIAQALACKPPAEKPWNYRAPFYGYLAKDLQRQVMRCLSQQVRADVLEFNALASQPRTVISLVHATRGRVKRATQARALWLSRSKYPERIEHIFAIDADDEPSQMLQRFRSVVCGGMGGCVEAWNKAALAAHGEIIVQLSDDWIPPRNWDIEIEKRLDISKPQVLEISDGYREDALLCMAILTKERLRQQGHLFHPDFIGVFSDTWFTHCAKRDGVLIDAKELVFKHEHPAFGVGKMDETYSKQNSAIAYAHGKKVYDKLMEGESK